SVVSAGVLGSAPNADAHHHAPSLAFAPPATTGDGDVLEDFLARLGIIDPLRVVPRHVPDHVRTLAKRAAHRISANPLRKQLQLALDLGQALHVYANVHASTPAPTTCPQPTGGALRGNK